MEDCEIGGKVEVGLKVDDDGSWLVDFIVISSQFYLRSCVCFFVFFALLGCDGCLEEEFHVFRLEDEALRDF